MLGKAKTRWLVSILFTLALHLAGWLYSDVLLPPAMATATARQQLSVTFVQSSAAAGDSTASGVETSLSTEQTSAETRVTPAPVTKEPATKKAPPLSELPPATNNVPLIEPVADQRPITSAVIPQPPAKKPAPPTRTVKSETTIKSAEAPAQKTSLPAEAETVKQHQKKTDLVSLEQAPVSAGAATTGSDKGTAETFARSSSSITSPTYEDLPLLTEPSFSRPPAPPEYPKRAQRKRIEGEVVLRARVDEQGLVRRIIVWQSSGHNLLDKAAEKAMWGWQFTPARQGSLRTAAWVEFPIRFAIH
ncbi:energy transducer TonB [Kiloniella laminariae]|uniref:energy transducer TonB n=1 Tax=Kiloniella laminariae TaxID=454162 RepID=UPI00037F5C75|nr:energy transducer TonB [Kiloniella laminariae]